MLGERPQAVISRLGIGGAKVEAALQFPYYLPDEDSVVAISHTLRDVALAHGDDVELHWIDAPSDTAKVLQRIGKDTVFWPVTDGYWPFIGSPLIGLLRGFGGRVFGSGPLATAISQNKYLQYSLFRSLDIPTPNTWRHGSKNPGHDSSNRYVAKPVDLGNSIGIFDDGIACSLSGAVIAAERIEALYGRRAIIQEYIDGAYCRASFVGGIPVSTSIGVHLALSEGSDGDPDPWTGFDAYFEAYKRRDLASNSDVNLVALEDAVDRGAVSETARNLIDECLSRLVESTDLSGIFSIDIVVRGDTPYFIEVNTNPFLRNAALQSYCREHWKSDAVSAIYRAIAER